MDTGDIVWIVVAVAVALLLLGLLAMALKKRSEHQTVAKREEAGKLRHEAAQRGVEVRRREAEAAAVEADARKTRAEAELRAAEADRLEMEARERRTAAASERSEVDQKWERAEHIDPDKGRSSGTPTTGDRVREEPVVEHRVVDERPNDGQQGPTHRG